VLEKQQNKPQTCDPYGSSPSQTSYSVSLLFHTFQIFVESVTWTVTVDLSSQLREFSGILVTVAQGLFVLSTNLK